MKKIGLLGTLAAVTALGLSALGVSAQTTNAVKNYPERTITVVVPYTPGGSVDTVARILTAQLQKQLGQPIVIENKPGASGMIGSGHVSKSNPDGYTLLLHASSHVYLPLVSANAKYDALRDFTPISRIGTVPLLIVTKPDAPFNTLQEMKAYAEKNRGTMNWATSGYGTSSHLVEEMLNRDLALGMPIIAYRGAVPQLTDVMAGHVSAAASPMPGAYPFVSSGKLKAIAVTSAQRVKSLPNVPTVAESGVKDFDFTSWYGVWGPAGLPKEIAEKLAAEINKALQSPEVQKAYETSMFSIVESSPADLEATQVMENKKIGQLAKDANILIK
jgi:tripartite-type tricarboxylate transporter receptor subunit TctC